MARQLVDIDTLASSGIIPLKKKTIYLKVAARQIPHVRIGRSVFFDISPGGEIEQWIETSRVPALNARREHA
jgi:predicted DNA-binding transcriptional regulator AlpA